MIFNDIPARFLTLRVKRTDLTDRPLPEQACLDVFSVSPCLGRPEEFEVRVVDSVIFVKPNSKTDCYRLGSELASGGAYIARLINPAKDGSWELKIAFFSGECLEMGDFDIGVDECVESAFKKILGKGVSRSEIYKNLEELCCFTHGKQRFFFITAGSAIDGEIKSGSHETTEESQEESGDNNDPDEAKDESLPTMPTLMPNRKNSFCVSGNGIRFIATEAQLPGRQTIFMISRFRKTQNQPDRALRIVRGKLRFVDWTQSGQIQMLAKAQMNELTKDQGSYLKKWDEFGDCEGELLLQSAREVGVLDFSNTVANSDGTVTVTVTNASDSAFKRLETGLGEVEIMLDIPDYLANPDLKFAEFVAGIEQAEDNDNKPEKGKKKDKDTRPYFKVSDYDRDSKTLSIKHEEFPASGKLILSLAGEIAQIKRRIFARRAILEGRAVNPQLGLLIEEKGEILPARQIHKIKPLTAYVRNKIFRNHPTIMQEKAIEVALNTPDIALIQGPPGTGKTTVIAAIIERMNELAEKTGTNLKGKVLLTGFQHDAVENMISRLSLNGIPVPKFGKRSGADEDDFNVFEKSLEDWCLRVAKDIREKNPEVKEIEKETEIKNLCLQYIKAPSRQLAANLARKIAGLGIVILGETLSRQATNLAKRLLLQENLNAQSNPRLESVRQLHTRPEGFADDGPERAADLMFALKDILEPCEYELLERASIWQNEGGEPPFLDDLGSLKERLLVKLSVPPVFRVEKQNDELMTLAREAVDRIRTSGVSGKDEKSTALAEFLAELESNPYGMIDAVSDYSYAYAATCQQSVGGLMQNQKGIKKGIKGENSEQQLEYELVIVDEAARVSPRDLMIPMAQGRRIILVGDHRQLPHIIDDEVARQMEQGTSDIGECEWLKKSMFEYLFSERLRALEKKDGIQRRVTLNTQYRMHPLLGDFVSRNFYERFDASERFDSGRTEGDFEHDLPGTEGKQCVWLEVPAEKGAHKRHGTSWTRPVEATAIVKQLKAWLESEAGKNLTYGVISFYKAQADMIRRQLNTNFDNSSQIRVGTVDSFQGMEFDVVFLSMVRTMSGFREHMNEDGAKQASRLFGHLCLYNRLNVSMSRQKKLLVVAGDSSLIKSDIARNFVPGLVDFFKLCNERGRVLQCR